MDDANGWDFYSGDKTVYDGAGDDHGTHVSGTIGGVGGNGVGVAGVNWNVKLISTEFLGTNGGYTSGAIKAVDYLTDLKARHGINIVASSNSWGGGGYSEALHSAILRGAKQGILFVAAAGNNSSNNDTTAYFPTNYSTLQGTSTTSAANIRSAILGSAKPTSSLSGKTVTGGRLDVAAALERAPLQQVAVSIAGGTATEGNSGTTPLSFTVTLAAAATEPVTVNYATVDGTAKAGIDYVATSGTVSFAPGETSQTIAVGQGIGTILNDDGVTGAARLAAFAAMDSAEQPRGAKKRG